MSRPSPRSLGRRLVETCAVLDLGFARYRSGIAARTVPSDPRSPDDILRSMATVIASHNAGLGVGTPFSVGPLKAGR